MLAAVLCTLPPPPAPPFVEITGKKYTQNPAIPMTGPVPFLAPVNANNNPNNANANTFFTGDQANTIPVVTSVICLPDNRTHTSSVSPKTVRDGPLPDTETAVNPINLSIRASGLKAGQASTGISQFKGPANATPEDQFANANLKFPPKEN